jgi:hypothetical protein
VNEPFTEERTEEIALGEETPPPIALGGGALPLDALTAKQIVELRVERDRGRALRLYAAAGGGLRPVDLPGGRFMLGYNDPALLLRLLRLLTGYRFEELEGGTAECEVWVRADQPLRHRHRGSRY